MPSLHTRRSLSPISLAVCATVLGIYLSSYMELPLWGMLTLLVCLLAMLGVAWLCRGAVSSWAFAVSLFLAGMLRGQLPDISLLPTSVTAYSLRLSDAAARYVSALPLRASTSALLQAMLLGHREHLPDALRMLYRDTGAAHVLALSGLHLGIVFGLLNCFMLRLLTNGWRYVMGCLSLMLVWGYALLTGFPISLCRAAVMVSVLLVAQMRLSGTDGWHSLSLAALLLLWLAPSSLWNIGFQLSFSAIAGILLFYKPLRQMFAPASRPLVWLLSALCVSLAAQMGTMPLLLLWFHRMAWLGILFSPLYILLATLLIYLSLLLLPLSAVGGGQGLCWVVERAADLQHGTMSAVASIASTQSTPIHWEWSHVVLTYAAMLSLLPLFDALRFDFVRPLQLRLYALLRRWPFAVTFLFLLTAVVLLP